MSSTAEALRSLHKVLQQLTDVQDRLERGPKRIKAGEVNVERLESELVATKEDLKKVQLASSQKELQLKEREGRIFDLKGKMNACSSNKEYQMLVEQIAADEQANSVMSDEILESFEVVSAHQAVVKTADDNVKTANAELETLSNKVNAEREQLESDVTRLKTELAAAEESLPPEVKDHYIRMSKASGEEAMAPVEDEVCGGCFQTLTANMMNELLVGRFIFCQSCGRLLYMPESTPEDAEE